MHSLLPASGLRRYLPQSRSCGSRLPPRGGPEQGLLLTWPRVPGMCLQASPSASDMDISNSVPKMETQSSSSRGRWPQQDLAEGRLDLKPRPVPRWPSGRKEEASSSQASGVFP